MAPESIAREVKKAAQISLDSFVTSTRMLILAYVGLTCLCAVLDVICFFTGVSWNSNDTEWWSYGVVNIFVLSSVYISCDLLYLIWAASQIIKLPHPIGFNTLLALIGIPNGLIKMAEQDQDAAVETPQKQAETARTLLRTENKQK